jgi:hypothetical protein
MQDPSFSLPNSDNQSLPVAPPEVPLQESAPAKLAHTLSPIKQSRAYFVEYALILITTGILLGVVTSMLSSIVRFTDSEKSSSFLDSYAYTASVVMIATLLVAVPLLLILTKRAQVSETLNPSIKNSGWRKAFLGIFLLVVSLYAIGYAIAFMYDLVSYFATYGLGDAAKNFPWRGLLENGVTALLFGVTAWLYAYDYRDQPDNRSRLARIHHYGLILLAILLTAVYLGTAFRQQRAIFIDETIVNDLQSIQTQVESYESKNNRLPASLDNLDLNKQQISRAKTYHYEYKKGRSNSSYTLCAEFKTDASKEKPISQNPLEAFSGSAYSSNYRLNDTNDDPSQHEKGRQCFDYQTYSDTYYEDPSPFQMNSTTRSSQSL